jgi:hypothetical protein
MKGAFRIAGFVVVLICFCGCSTPEQRQAWGQVFQGMANQTQSSYQQYQMEQLQHQMYKINDPYVK